MLYLSAGFLKLSVAVDHYMRGLRTRAAHEYRNIPVSHKEHAITPVSANMRKIIVKVDTFSIERFKVEILRQFIHHSLTELSPS
jgi:hypothetical protein